MSEKSNNPRCFSQPLIHSNGLNNLTPVSLPALSLLNDHTGNSLNLDKVHLSLSVLRLDPADRAVIKIADERDAIQKKAFTNWVNQHLVKVIISIMFYLCHIASGTYWRQFQT
ncbi:unnamed protein product [Trichobilharzia regenti]|nr:unnamed protein product [Trichobilharzia regenti]